MYEFKLVNFGSLSIFVSIDISVDEMRVDLIIT